MRLIDTHCHLNLDEAFPDLEAEVRFAQQEGVDGLVVIGIDVASSKRAIEIADQFEGVFATLGVHPNHSSDFTEQTISELAALAAHPKVKAIGEIGLDYHWNYASRDEQFRALEAQLALAEQNQLPIVFHCREAYSDLLGVLESKQPKVPCVLHCFAGNESDAERAQSLDCYFGVDGPLTYKNAETLRQIVRKLPQDRVLVETDAPYLTPVPFRGKPNRPAYVKFVNSMLASIWEVSPEAAAEQTTANAVRFFDLPFEPETDLR